MGRDQGRYPGVRRITGKKGETVYRISYEHPKKGRVRKTLRGVSEARAAEIRGMEIADALRGETDRIYELEARPAAPSFESMVAAYLRWAGESPDHKSDKTDAHNAKPLLVAFKGKLMSDITPWMIDKYKLTRVKERARATVNNEISLGSMVYRKALEWGRYQGENPFLGRKFKRERGKKPGALTPEQAEAIMEAIAHPVKRDMVAFAYYAGWRVSEIRKLKWADVNMETGTAWISDPKNKQPVEIELSDMALEIVKRQPQRGEGSPVFCHKNGKPYKTNLGDVVKAAAKRAGVYLPPRKRWHIFRRTWASMMLQAGCDVETLRVLGNWKDFAMPLWYAEAAGREGRRTALNKVPRLLGKNRATIAKTGSASSEDD